jgi:predicted DNA-binding transcriptional regulator YafY
MEGKKRGKQAPRVHLHAYERLRQICIEIQKCRCPTKAALARLVEHHPRTVQRDLEALRDRFGAPLVFDRASNGFKFSDPAWQLPPITLSEGELINFFAAERMLRRLGATAEADIARGALKKLAALLPEEVVIDAGALDAAITFAHGPVLDASPETLRELASGAARHRTLTIDYYSQRRSARTNRDVDVLLLHNHLGEWYAVCQDHDSGEVRDFHAGRIFGISETGRKFTPPESWDSDEYLSKGFGMYRGGKPVLVEVEFDAYQARYARERTFHSTERRKELAGGRLRIRFQTTENALEQVARWLLGYGEHVRALRPVELRRMIVDQLKQAIKLYSSTG